LLFNNLEISDVLSGSTSFDASPNEVDSIKCRICTCRTTTVQLAQLNRKAKDVASTKGGNEICNPPFSVTAEEVSHNVFVPELIC